MPDPAATPTPAPVNTVVADVTKATSFVSAEELWFRQHQFISGLISGGLIVSVIAITIAIITK